MVYISLFVIVCVSSLASYIDKKKYGTFFAPTSVLAWPLTVSTLLLVIFGRTLGFYDINPAEVFVLSLGIGAFSAGSVLATYVKDKIIEHRSSRGQHTRLKDSHVEIEWKDIVLPAKWITSATLLIGAVRLLVLIFRNGIREYVATDGYNAALMYGLPAHLILVGYTLAPLLLADAILNKKFLSGILWFGYVILMFSSFVKYHVVLLVLVSFFFVMIIEKKTAKILLPLLIVLPIVLFLLSYVFIFSSKDLTFKDNYLAKHLLNYLCCGILYTSVSVNVSLISHIDPLSVFITQFAAIPNKIFELVHLPQWPMASPPYVYLSKTERGNVINIITMFFVTKNYLVAFLLTLCFSLLLSFFVYRTSNKLTSSVILGLLVLSFFGDFFALFLVWEVLVYSFVLWWLISFFSKSKPKHERI